MGQLLHGSARTTAAVRRAIQHSQESIAKLAERCEASWEHNIRLAQVVDEVGMEGMVPISRWKGYGASQTPTAPALNRSPG
jgi:hypothetical protein